MLSHFISFTYYIYFSKALLPHVNESERALGILERLAIHVCTCTYVQLLHVFMYTCTCM